MTRFIACYVVAQVVLLPLYALYLWVVPRAGLRFQWALHRAVFCLAVLLPFALLVPPRMSAPQPIGALSQSVERIVAPLGHPSDAQSASTLSVQPPRASTLPFGSVLALPAAGALAFAARLARQKRRERALEAAGYARRIGRVVLVVSPRVTVPFSTGLLRPRIFLPPGIAEDLRAFRMVFRHESIHIRRAHWVWTMIESLAASVLWFNPMMHMLARGGRRVRELSCDAEVCRRHSPIAYGRLLLDTAASVSCRPQPTLVDSWIREGMLRERILFLLHGRKLKMRLSTRISTLGAFVVAGVFLALGLPFLTPAAAQSSEDSHEPLLGWRVPFARTETVTVTMDAAPGSEITFSSSGDTVTVTSDGRIFTTSRTFAGGVDYFVPLGVTEAAAIAEGMVTSVTSEPDGTVMLMLETESGYRLVYSHLKNALVKPNERVSHGQSVGTLLPSERWGRTYNSLHLAFWRNGREVNPFALPLPTSSSATLQGAVTGTVQVPPAYRDTNGE